MHELFTTWYNTIMPRKSKKHKVSASRRRTEKVTVKQVSKSDSPAVKTTVVEKKPVYKETDYDKLLRKFTIKDTFRTLVITTIIFALQIGIYYSYQAGLLVNILP